MQGIIKELLDTLEHGELREHENMCVLPVISPAESRIRYLTMKEALDQRLLTVTEVSEGGSVPNLKVRNDADIPVLLLDGEELTGAKQNRVLNTTVLLKERSDTVIPVSCTEQGRWSYSSKDFRDSGVVMSRKVQFRKAQSVSRNLEMNRNFSSDQGAVWADIAERSSRAGVHSPTGAMREIFEKREKDIDAYLDAFPPVDRQRGMLVSLNGEPAGLDFISYEPAFRILMRKLLKSYAVDAVIDRNGGRKRCTKKKAEAFVRNAARCKEKLYDSTGYGTDHRLRNGSVIGSALVYSSEVIHTAFFAVEGAAGIVDDEQIAGFRRRRRYRQ